MQPLHPESGTDTGRSPAFPRWLAVFVPLCVLLLIAVAFTLPDGWWDRLSDPQEIQRIVALLGIAGPLAVIGLMVLAILFSPLPSAPIAMAAGAAYGHVWGTLYVIAGAELGAILAFLIARTLGAGRVERWIGRQPLAHFAASQNVLMAIVFASRLLPFLSFDLISYVAGLTALRLWRFAMATLVGIVPASFLLAHFGNEMATRELDRMAYALAMLGALTALSVIGQHMYLRWRKARVPGQPDRQETEH